jgi:type IV pilus assembly protein PilW
LFVDFLLAERQKRKQNNEGVEYQAMKQLSKGFSLIELMVALLIGAILILGIASIFTNASSNIRLQRGIASIQENGRIAMSRLTNDLSQAGSLYCNTLDYAVPVRGTATGAVGVTPSKAVQIVSNATTAPSAGGLFYGYPSRATVVSGFASSQYMVMGHECDAGACTPALTAVGSVFPALPAMGSAAGNRVPGADVVTVRRVSGFGAPITGVTGDANSITWTFPSNQLARLNATAGASGFAMIGTCNSAALFRTTLSGDGLSATAAAANHATPMTQFLERAAGFDSLSADPRFFWVESNFLTVTYFLQNVADPSNAARIIPTLMRQENGSAPVEVARGVARFDVRYALTNTDDQVRWLTANDVHTGSTPVNSCNPRAFKVVAAEETACGWRNVTAIEFGLLMQTVDDVGANLEERNFSYSMGGQYDVAVPAGSRTLFREFRSIVPIENRAR